MNKHIIAAALLAATTAVPAAALAQNYGYGHGGNGGYNNGGYGSRTQGTIGSVRGGNVQLTNGRNIFLHNGTVINPTGTTLQPGQQIFVTGNQGGNGAINADQIDVSGYGNNRYGGGWNNNGRGNNQYGGSNNGRGNNDDRNWHRHRRGDNDDHQDGDNR